MSFELENSKTVALVGHSGCGKSTIVNLLLRFYNINSGQVVMRAWRAEQETEQILYNGMPLEELSIRGLRASIGVVSQEPTLFEGSVEGNIQLGNEGATRAQIISAAKQANAHQFVTQLPQVLFLGLSFESKLESCRATKRTSANEA